MGVTDSGIPRICDERLLFCIGENNMRQVAFVVLGLVASYVFMLLGNYVLVRFLHVAGIAGIAPAFIILIPVSLLAGSMVTGFLGHPLMNTKWSMIWIAPGFYIVVFILFMFLVSRITGSNKSADIWMILFLPLYWYIASLAGVWLGYFMRGLFSHRKSD